MPSVVYINGVYGNKYTDADLEKRRLEYFKQLHPYKAYIYTVVLFVELGRIKNAQFCKGCNIVNDKDTDIKDLQ